MFVEIVRLFIVFLATAGGFAVGQGAQPAGHGPALGATLGACIGYVAGGAIGRLLRGAMGQVEEHLEQAPAPRLFAGALGGITIGGLFAVIGIPAVLLVPGRAGWPILGLLIWIGSYQGFVFGARKSDELLAMAGLSSRPLVRATPYGDEHERDAVLVDTSAIIDGRLLALARSGFLRDSLLVPRFVLDEVQAIADVADPARRRRGRRGLEILDALRAFPDLEVHVLDDEVPELEEVDAKLVELSKRLRVRLLTVDAPLQRSAELQGVRCLSLQRLTDGVKAAAHVPGDVVELAVTREGKERGQGVGFLDDGTMVVVNEAIDLLGSEAKVRILSTVQTSVGRMLFASLAVEQEEAPAVVPERSATG